MPLSRVARLNTLLLDMSSTEMLLPRQIKAVNVWKSYFSSDTVMLKTLLAAVQWKLGLDLEAVTGHATVAEFELTGLCLVWFVRLKYS